MQHKQKDVHSNQGKQNAREARQPKNKKSVKHAKEKKQVRHAPYEAKLIKVMQVKYSKMQRGGERVRKKT